MSGEAVSAMRPEVEIRVRRFVLALQSSEQAKHVLAVIVAGSSCRGEEIWRNGRLISDIDLMLVTRHTNPYRTRSLAAIMREFRTDGINGGATPLPSLHRFRTFAFYEARANGVVVWGGYGIGRLLPPMASTDIPRWEAIRILANRMFEHLKLTCGQTTPEQAATKSYEALVEASLALEQRYRPSYKARLLELTMNPPGLLPSHVYHAAAGVLRARLGEGQRVATPDTDAARHDLLCGLHDALHHYLQADGTLTQLLDLLGQQEHHWRHRAYWAISRPKQMSALLRTDPCIALWQKAAVALQASPIRNEAEELVNAWNACPSILRRHDPAYADGLSASSAL